MNHDPLRPAIPETLGDRSPQLIACGIGAFRPSDREALAALIHEGSELLQSIVGLYRSGLIVPTANNKILSELQTRPDGRADFYYMTLSDSRDGDIGEQILINKVEAVRVFHDQEDLDFHKGSLEAAFAARLAAEQSNIPVDIINKAMIAQMALPDLIAIDGDEATVTLDICKERLRPKHNDARHQKTSRSHNLDQQLDDSGLKVDLSVRASSINAGISSYSVELQKRRVTLGADKLVVQDVPSDRAAKRSDLVIAREISHELMQWARERVAQQG